MGIRGCTLVGTGVVITTYPVSCQSLVSSNRDNPGALAEKVTVKFRGATFVVEEDQVPALMSQLGIGPFRPLEPGISKGTRKDHEATLLVALRAVLAQPKGVASPDLAAVMGLRGARGIPMIVRVWRRALAQQGFKFDEVFSQSRDSQVRYWHPGPRAKEAVKAFERRRVSRQRT